MFMRRRLDADGDANLFGVYDHQGGLRGAAKTYSAGMVMGMAAAPGRRCRTLGFRAMLSPTRLWAQTAIRSCLLAVRPRTRERR